MTIPKLTPYTGQVANPDGSQTQTEFTQNMFNQLSYEAQLATELDATVDGMNQAVTDVENNATAASASATAAEAAASTAGYQGLWPDTGGIADKGDTYQTQVGGTPTGEYYTALQNTSVNPVGDNVNWKDAGAIGQQNISDYTDLVFDTVNDMKAGDLQLGSIAKTSGYHSKGDGGGFSYNIVIKSGQAAQNSTINIPLDNGLAAVPIIDTLTGACAGVVPLVATDNNFQRLQDLAGRAFQLGQRVVEIRGDVEYFCDGELNNVYNTTFVGDGKILSPNKNNYYKRIYPKQSMSECLTINNSNGANFKNFLDAIRRRDEGGANPVVVFVGDSLTQGAHRASDNYWFVKDFERKLRDSFGAIDFFNRGVAGSKISQLDEVVQDVTPINAPYEPQWNTVPGQLLRDYVAALNPDLVVISYGMNSGDSAADTQAIIDARTNLLSVYSSTDIVWVTSPIRTTDLNPEFGGQKFGTYPKNEQSNHAGLVTRHLAQLWGDYCIDVNRMSNIVQLGQDPVNFRINRWSGQFKTLDNKWTNDNLFTIEADSSWTLNLSGANLVSSLEMFRNTEIVFDINSISYGSGDLRVSLRDDPEGQGELLFQFLPTEVRLIGYRNSSGTQATWSVVPDGKNFRIRVIGTEVKLYIDNVETAPSTGNADGLYQSMFLAPIGVQVTSDATAQLTNFNVNAATRYDYNQHVPRLTPYQIFNIADGDGGNNLNHPNTLGEREMYGQPITEFVSWLSGQNVPTKTRIEDIPVTGSSGTLKAVVSGQLVNLHFEDFTVSGSTGSAPIVTLPAELRPFVAASSTLGRINVTDQSKRVQVRANGGIYIVDGTGTASWSGTVTYFNS